MMYESEKSDSAIVAVKPANKTAVSAVVAQWVEPRAGTKGNTEQSHTRRTQSRCSVSQRLDRIRNAARQRKKEKFTALLHHVSVDLLWESFLALKRHAAAGIDGVTWDDYEVHLEQNLQELHKRAQSNGFSVCTWNRDLPRRRAVGGVGDDFGGPPRAGIGRSLCWTWCA